MGLFNGGGGFFGGGSGLFGGGSSLFGGGSSSRGGSSYSPIKNVISDGPDRTLEKITREFIKEHDEGPVGQLYRAVDDFKDEAEELLTVGVYEMVIKGNKNYKTSFELKEEASKLIGKQAYRYDEACQELRKNIDILNESISKTQERKKKILGNLGFNVTPQENINNITGNSPDKPTYNSNNLSDYILNSFSIIGSTNSIADRVQSANEYLEDAKDYEVRVSAMIADMQRINVKIGVILSLLDEENKLLSALEESISLKRDLAYKQIAEKLAKTIAMYIMDKTGEPDSQYVQIIEQLKVDCSKY